MRKLSQTSLTSLAAAWSATNQRHPWASPYTPHASHHVMASHNCSDAPGYFPPQETDRSACCLGACCCSPSTITPAVATGAPIFFLAWEVDGGAWATPATARAILPRLQQQAPRQQTLLILPRSESGRGHLSSHCHGWGNFAWAKAESAQATTSPTHFLSWEADRGTWAITAAAQAKLPSHGSDCPGAPGSFPALLHIHHLAALQICLCN